MRALVLAYDLVQETDKDVVLLTPDLGKIRVRAKGAAKMESKLRAGLLPFNTVNVALLPSKNNGFLLRTASQEAERKELRKDLCALAGAATLADLFSAMTLEGVGDARVFELAEKAFDALEKGMPAKETVARAAALLCAQEGLRPPKTLADLPSFIAEHFEGRFGSIPFLQAACVVRSNAV